MLVLSKLVSDSFGKTPNEKITSVDSPGCNSISTCNAATAFP